MDPSVGSRSKLRLRMLARRVGLVALSVFSVLSGCGNQASDDAAAVTHNGNAGALGSVAGASATSFGGVAAGGSPGQATSAGSSAAGSDNAAGAATISSAGRGGAGAPQAPAARARQRRRGAGGAGGAASAGAGALGISKRPSVLSNAGVTIVSYGGYLNGESFQQDGIVSYAGYQYAAFWNTARHVVFAGASYLAARGLPSSSATTRNTEGDAHNTISIGICPGVARCTWPSIAMAARSTIANRLPGCWQLPAPGRGRLQASRPSPIRPGRQQRAWSGHLSPVRARA